RGVTYERVGREGDAAARVAGEKVLQNSGTSEGAVSRENDVTLAVAEGAATEAIAVDFGAKFQCVFSDDVGNMIHELIPLIGTLEFGPLESAQCFENAAEAFYLKARQTAIERIGYAVIDTQACRRIRVVGRLCRLVQGVVAEYLGSGVYQRKPLWLKFNRVIDCSGIVSEEVHSAQGVTLIDVVINLSDCVIGAHDVGKSGLDLCSIGTVIRRETRTVARDWRAWGASRHLEADRTDSGAVGLQVGDRVRDAV